LVNDDDDDDADDDDNDDKQPMGYDAQLSVCPYVRQTRAL